MARPAPKIICEHTEDALTFQIGEANAIYAILYKGKPIKLRRFNENLRYQGYKYSKTSFPEPGHALRLARHLNLVHDTTDFGVAVMTIGRIIPLN